MTDSGKTPHYRWQRIVDGQAADGQAPKANGGDAQASGRKKAVDRNASSPADTGRKGGGCRTERQRMLYPEGRTRLTQFLARTPLQGTILTWIASHRQHCKGTSLNQQTRQTATWRLLEAGWNALRGDHAAPPSLEDDHPPLPDTPPANSSSIGDLGGSAAARRPQGDSLKTPPSVFPKPAPEETQS